MTVIVVAETAMIVLLTILVAGLLRSNAEILRTLSRMGINPQDGIGEGRNELPSGSQPYDVAGRTPDGDAVHIGVLGDGPATLLAFLSSGCTTCEPLWEGLRRGEPSLPDRARVVVVTRGPGQESPALLRALSPPGVPVVMSDAAWADYGIPGSPYFVYAAGNRILGEGTAQGFSQLRSLLDRAAAEALRPRPHLHEPA